MHLHELEKDGEERQPVQLTWLGRQEADETIKYVEPNVLRSLRNLKSA